MLTFIYSIVVDKCTTYFSNVVAPQRPATFCGVPIKSIFFVTSPLDFGINFNFISYNGYLLLCSAADSSCVPNAQLVVDKVHEALIKQTGEVIVATPSV